MNALKIKDYAKYYKTEDYLFGEMAETIRARNPIYITRQELLYIIFWKSPRNLHSILENSKDDVKEISKLALSREDDWERIRLLTTEIKGKKLKGVGVAIASAILTVINPNLYGVIDFHAWRALYNKEKNSQFDKKDYMTYLQDIRRIAKEENSTPREIDKGLLIKDIGLADI